MVRVKRFAGSAVVWNGPGSLRSLLKPIGELTLDPRNARKHSDSNVRSLAEIIGRFGQRTPFVAQKARNGALIVRKGNGGVLALRSLGWTHAAVVVVDEDDTDATAYALADNRSSELSEWDDETLANLLKEMQAADQFAGLGWTPDDLDALLSSLAEETDASNVTDAGAQAVPIEPVTRKGDLWILGDHRLLCGDALDPSSYKLLMDGKKAHLLATDPPYLVDYDENAGAGKASEEVWDRFENEEQATRFFVDWLKLALQSCVERIPIYQWHAFKRQRLVETAWLACKLLVHQQIIWSKSRGVMTRSDFRWAHEPCFYGWIEGMRPIKNRRPPPTETTVWDIAQADEGGSNHPTAKPLEVFEKPILWHTTPGEVVLEPFCGSGTQIIAAEKLKRRCFAMELSPGYVDAAVARWEKSTGKKAKTTKGKTLKEV